MRGSHELKIIIDSIHFHIDDIIRRLMSLKKHMSEINQFDERLASYLRNGDICNLKLVIEKCYDLYFHSTYSEKEVYEIIHSAYQKSGLNLKIGFAEYTTANEFFKMLYRVYYSYDQHIWNWTSLT